MDSTEHADVKPPTDRPWHALQAAEALQVLGSAAEGLSAEVAAERLERFGHNTLPEQSQPALLQIFAKQFKSPLIYLLGIAAVLSVVLGDVADAAFIFAVLQINAVIGATQEWKAESGAAALRAHVRTIATVRRGRQVVRVDGVELVPGDIVIVESGAQVPADIRLIEAAELRVDESLLTGESLPVDRRPAPPVPEDAPIGDRATMLHAGSIVLGGRGVGVVARTGTGTEIGRIAKALDRRSPPPPLLVRLERFTRTIGVVTVAAVIALVAVQIAMGAGLREVFFIAIALAVSAIPEGLPVAVTVTLSVATARMARRNVIVRLLPAVEGLGVCTVIASDKTGTLTANQLTIKRLYLPGIGDLDVPGEGLSPLGEPTRAGAALSPPERAAAERFVLSGMLANQASYTATAGTPTGVGDTVDLAFLVLGAKLRLQQQEVQQRHPLIRQIPFSAERRWAAAFARYGDRMDVHIKGAPEAVLPMCAGTDHAALLKETERLAGEGYRVLALACAPVHAALDEISDPGEQAEAALCDLEFMGLAGLIDPVRSEVPDAIARCRRAGVEVRMVTGDHPATALAIARQIGIAQREDEVVTGRTLAGLEDQPDRVAELIHSATVFARIEPAQKTLIVTELQRAGHIVAVTGDGVNDAPALHVADIGVAMGRDGTDVARSAADLILTDDNFASIVAGIEEGRIAYANVRKVIYLVISTGAAEVLIFFLSILFGLPLPLFAAQLLWLNLVTNGGQDVALAFERGEPGHLHRRPRSPREPIFDRRMVEEAALSGAWIAVVCSLFFAWALHQGWSEFDARNALLLLMVMFQNIHVFNCRSEERSAFRVPLRNNRLLILAVAAAQGIHIGAMFTPGLSDLLRIAPIPIDSWLIVLPIAATILPIMELYKAIRPNIGEQQIR